MIVANLATYPPRRSNLLNVVAKVSPQVDILNVVLNEYNTEPEELKCFGNVCLIIPEENLKDVGKFYPKTRNAQYVFLIDDDIIYPTDYVSRTVSNFEALGIKRSIGGYHASIYYKPGILFFLKHPVLGFRYKEKVANFRQIFHYSIRIDKPMAVDQLGSGTVILRGKDMPPYKFMEGSQGFVDVRLARWCYEQRIMSACLKRKKNWLESIDFEETIFENVTEKNFYHVTEEILSYAFKIKHSVL